jgi:AcrR family transcriptional regulator
MTSLTEKESSHRGDRGARKRILDAASELFYFEGINATGVGRIANKASVSKRTLYQHFPSKTALVEEYLRQLRQETGQAEDTPAEDSGTTPRAQLLALFDITDAGDARLRGCPFHNAAVEAAGAMPGVEHIVHLHKRDCVHGLTHLARGRSGGPGDAGQPGRAALRGCIRLVDLAQRSGALGACASGSGGPHRPSSKPLGVGPRQPARPHFDVVAAARTASLTAVGVTATTAFWTRLAISRR